MFEISDILWIRHFQLPIYVEKVIQSLLDKVIQYIIFTIPLHYLKMRNVVISGLYFLSLLFESRSHPVVTPGKLISGSTSASEQVTDPAP